MEGEEAAEMRERSKVLGRRVADCCLETSGSSQIAMDKLVSYILAKPIFITPGEITRQFNEPNYAMINVVLQ